MVCCARLWRTKALHLAGEEVDQGLADVAVVDAAEAAVEGVASVLQVAGLGVIAGADDLPAEGDLVLAAEVVDVVGEVFGVDVEEARGAGSAADGEVVG